MKIKFSDKDRRMGRAIARHWGAYGIVYVVIGISVFGLCTIVGGGFYHLREREIYSLTQGEKFNNKLYEFIKPLNKVKTRKEFEEMKEQELKEINYLIYDAENIFHQSDNVIMFKAIYEAVEKYDPPWIPEKKE